MTGLLQGLRAMRANQDRRDGMHQSRQRPQINFVQVDPAEHERQVAAERAALMREREIEERTVARLKAEAEAQARKAKRADGMTLQQIAEATGVPKSTIHDSLVSFPNSENSPETIVGKDGKSYPARKPRVATPVPVQPKVAKNRYAHLHEDAVWVWSYVTEHNDAALSLTEIAGVLGLTVSEVSHRLRQLENNGIVRRGYDGVITLVKRTEENEL